MTDSTSARLPRIFHGPVNITGIGRYLADWQRSQGTISDFIVHIDHTNRQNNHLNLQLDAYGRLGRLAIRLALFCLCLAKYDLFHFYFAQSLLPLNLDLPLLKLFKKKILMTYCGSEARLVEVEQQMNPYAGHLKTGLNHPAQDKNKKRTLAWHNRWVDKVFAPRQLYVSVSSIIPEKKIVKDIWIHNTMDMAAYQPTFKTNPVPKLVHAPSNPAIKGSAHVEKAIVDLEAAGYQFDYIRLESVPHPEAERIYREEADIIIDQLYLGDFGSLAVEGMYYGKPVCTFLVDSLTQGLPDLPIVNCNVDNLTEKLAFLIDNPHERTRLGKAGRAFVEKYCDREQINVRLWQLYHQVMQN